MKYKTVLFDFDGTVADSEQVGLEVLNALAGEFGYEPIQESEVSELKGKSARELIATRLHVPLWRFWTVRKMLRRGREEFGKRSASIRTFPGIKEVIRELRKNVRVGVVSSNAEQIVRNVLQQNSIDVDFIDGGSGLFGKARALRRVLMLQSLKNVETLYIGDELRDIEACEAAGLPMLAVGWGLNESESLRAAGVEVAADSQELLRMIQR